MAAPSRMNLLNPTKVSVVATIVLGAIFAIWTYFSIEARDDEVRSILGAQVSTVLRTEQELLHRGDIRALVEKIGGDLSATRVEIRSPNLSFDLDAIKVREICHSSRVSAGAFDGTIAFCREAPLPLNGLLAAAGVFMLFAILLIGAVFNLERIGRRTIARVLTESGVSVGRGESLSALAANVNSMVCALSDARKAERELAAEAAVGRMAQILAHDVRRPLSVVRAGVAMISRASSPDDVRRAVAALDEKMDSAAHRVELLIKDVLDAGREAPLKLAPASLRQVIARSWEDLRVRTPIARGNVTISHDHKHQVVADCDKIERVISNILDNAVAAAGRDAKIWIRTEEVPRPNGSSVARITIGNTGSYISEGERAQVFESFFTRGKAQGTGLGLAIARKIIEAHGGSIWCTSRMDVAGEPETEFVVEVPTAGVVDCDIAEPAVADESRIGGVSPTEPKAAARVVLLDDDPFLREAWVSGLPGISLREFDRPEDFLDDLESNPELYAQTQAVITDQFFGPDSELSGIELASKLLSNGFGAKIVLSTDADIIATELPDGVTKVSKCPEVVADAVRKACGTGTFRSPAFG